MIRTLAAALAACLLLAGCTKPAAPDWTGDYRAALQLPGGELPFGLVITREGDGLAAEVINANERLRITEVSIEGEVLRLDLPGFENHLTLRREGNLLRGELFLVKARGRHQRIALTAVPGAAPRFFPAPAAPGGDISGRWAVTFTPDDGDPYSAIGEFLQSGSDVTGTFLTPTGDYRFLSGEMREGRLYLGTFNGGWALLFHAQLQSDGARMTGDYWSGLASHERFEAQRDESASLGDTQLTEVRKAGERFAFRFPDTEGNEVSLEDPRFAGKVVVVTVAGSWCPNCHDEAAFFAPYYTANRAAGLEMIGLMFEQLETLPEVRAAVGRFRDRWQITYPLLLAGTTADNPSAKLPQLNGIHAYPTTIFIDRKGVVRHIHTGFSGPATGEHHAALTADFDRRIQALLAETI